MTASLRDISNSDKQRRVRELEELIQAAVAKGDTPKAIALGREARNLKMQLALERTRKYRQRIY